MRLLMIDNYDSFTYNLVQYLSELGAEVEVVRNDVQGVDELLARSWDGIVISPGPCTPAEAGVSVQLIRQVSGTLPLLGVCLGHQSLAVAFGGRIVRAGVIMHGKTSPITHLNEGLFSDLPAGFAATRYHSLVVEQATLPSCLRAVAWTLDPHGETIMGLQHEHHPSYGVQFHPESILTVHGKKLLNNFLNVVRSANGGTR